MNGKILGFLVLILALPALASAETKNCTPLVQVRGLENSVVPKNATRLKFLEVEVQTRDCAIFISGLEVRRNGLSSFEDLGRIWAETANFRRSRRTQIQTDDSAQILWRSPILVPRNENFSFSVLGNIDSNSGRTIGVEFLHLLGWVEMDF